MYFKLICEGGIIIFFVEFDVFPHQNGHIVNSQILLVLSGKANSLRNHLLKTIAAVLLRNNIVYIYKAALTFIFLHYISGKMRFFYNNDPPLDLL